MMLNLLINFGLDVELVIKMIQSNEIMASITRIANDKTEDFTDNSDIHVLAKRVLTILQDFKTSHPVEEYSRRSAGQKQR